MAIGIARKVHHFFSGSGWLVASLALAHAAVLKVNVGLILVGCLNPTGIGGLFLALGILGLLAQGTVTVVGGMFLFMVAAHGYTLEDVSNWAGDRLKEIFTFVKSEVDDAALLWRELQV